MNKKLDETIENLCDYIKELTKANKLETPIQVAENTKALASLVEARAKM